MKKKYRIFVRNWWRKDGQGRLVPDPSAHCYTIGHADTQEDARAICKLYNLNHDPGELSRKAEYTSSY